MFEEELKEQRAFIQTLQQQLAERGGKQQADAGAAVVGGPITDCGIGSTELHAATDMTAATEAACT